MNGCDGGILIVDDEAIIALALSDMLEDMGLRVCGSAPSAREAVELAELHRPSLVLMDVRLRGPGDGVDAAIEIHKRYGTPIIFITGSREPATVNRIRQDHPAAILFKPILPEQLSREITRVLS